MEAKLTTKSAGEFGITFAVENERIKTWSIYRHTRGRVCNVEVHADRGIEHLPFDRELTLRRKCQGRFADALLPVAQRELLPIA